MRRCACCCSKPAARQRRSGDHDAGQVGVADRIEVRLGLCDGAGARPAESAHHVPARQGARRLERDQRDDLHSRPSVLFRSLGARRQSGLGIRGAAALFQEVGAQRDGRDAVSRRRWAAGRLALHRSPCRPPGVPGRGRAAAIQGRRALRLQPADAGERRRLLPEEHPRRKTPQRRRCVPDAGAVAPEPRSAIAVPGDEARRSKARRAVGHRVPARRQARSARAPRGRSSCAAA